MSEVVDLYDSHYARAQDDVYRAVRAATFDEDFGQTSWITGAECDAFARDLGLRAGSRLLEVACGSGGTALRLVARSGAAAVGMDLHADGVRAAAQRARELGLDARAEFRVADADEPLPFPDASFDALFCNDAVNHLRDRARVLREWARVLRPGGRLVYTDPCVVTGALSDAEVAARSSIGRFLFVPRGLNEQCVRDAGLELEGSRDATDAVASTSRRWRDAREAHAAALRGFEGAERFESFQRFLATVHALSSERRLSRFAYSARKPQLGS